MYIINTKHLGVFELKEILFAKKTNKTFITLTCSKHDFVMRTHCYLNILKKLKSCLLKQDNSLLFAQKIQGKCHYDNIDGKKGMSVFTDGHIMGKEDLLSTCNTPLIDKQKAQNILHKWEKYSCKNIPKDLEEVNYLKNVMLGL